MAKIRIHELARELNVPINEIFNILDKNNIVYKKTHLTGLEEETRKIVVGVVKTKMVQQKQKNEISRGTEQIKTNITKTEIPVKQNEIKKTIEENVSLEAVKKETPLHIENKVAIKQDQQPVNPRPIQNNQQVNKPQGQNRPPYNNNYQNNNANRPNNNRPNTPRPQVIPTQNRPQQGQQQQQYPQGQNRPPYNNNNQGQANRPQQGQNTSPQQNQQGGQQQQGLNNRPLGQNRPPYNNNNRPKDGVKPAFAGSTPVNKPQFSANKPDATKAAVGKKPAYQSDKNKGPNNNNRPNNNSNNNRGRSTSYENRNVRNNRGRIPLGSPAPKIEVPKPTNIKMGEFISVKDLAEKMKREVADIIKKLFMMGMMVTINQEIDFDTATLVAAEYQVEVEELPPEQDPTEIPEVEDDPAKRVFRSPVVTVMGHVDHGKTSLLDVIRKTNVIAREAGGITQHIGAYQVNYQGKKIVFLDTPGHEAFTAMRARGARVTDIAILVVAADDGVMPQTIEAINHAKSAQVPIIVAINKIDRENASPDHVKQQLAEYGLQAEDWGGDTVMVPVSAKQKIGIPDLLEMILLVAEMQELKANPNLPAQGTIVEAELDKGRGVVATVLVQKGTLYVGDTIIAGSSYGKVRAMINERGEKVKKAGPSTPVEVLGLSDVPEAGDVIDVTDEKTARSVAEKRLVKKRMEEMQQNQKVSLDDIFRQIQEGKIKDLNIVMKADVQGSIEALKQSLENIKNDEVKVVIVHSGVGAINESDVILASAANAIIIGFNVRPDNNARKAAEVEKVDISLYRVIYDAINDVEAAIKGMLAPKLKETILGRVEIRQLITINKNVIAGCYVTEGKITRNSQIRLLRDGVVVHEGVLESLRRFKDDAKEVLSGFECGITIDKFRDIKEGDVIEPYIMENVVI